MTLRLFNQAHKLIEDRKPFAFCIVASTQGSVPVKTGSMMIVESSGDVIGTIGGSELEEKVRTEALKCIQNHATYRNNFELNYRKETGEDVACGGKAEVWAFPVFGPNMFPAQRVSQLIKQRKPFVVSVLLRLNSGSLFCTDDEGYVSLYAEDNAITQFIKKHSKDIVSSGRSKIIQYENNPVLFVDFDVLPSVLICGGGHIGYELAKLLDGLGYIYHVVDDREKFGSKSRFPNSYGIHKDINELELHSFSHVVVVSYSQSVDYAYIKQLLKSGYKGYIGLIGSKSKRLDFKKRLEKEGIEKFEQYVNCPVGININAKSVHEIAVSIAAEIIQSHMSRSHGE